MISYGILGYPRISWDPGLCQDILDVFMGGSPPHGRVFSWGAHPPMAMFYHGGLPPPWLWVFSGGAPPPMKAAQEVRL